MKTFLALLIAIAGLFPQPLPDPNAAAGAHAKKFDGVDDYFSHTSATGFADAKSFACSLWFKRDATGTEALLGGQDSFFRWRIWFSSDKVRAIAANSAGTTILVIDSTNAITDTTWHHLLISLDLSDTSKRHMYIDDASETIVVTTYTNDTIDFTNANYAIAAVAGSGSLPFNGCLTEIWFDDGLYLDFSSAATRRKFIDQHGMPVYLGPTGATPTGAAPVIYIPNGNGAQNQGAGADFTPSGAVATASSIPKH